MSSIARDNPTRIDHPNTFKDGSNRWMQYMFDSVWERYNLTNRIITFGQDALWRNRVLDMIKVERETKILDICTGTGDLALKIAKRFPCARTYAIDFSPSMLALARERAAGQGIKNIFLKENDCRSMEFDNNYFDYVTVSFGFRNLSYSRANLEASLKEIHRVLKNEGRLIILETSQPVNNFIKKFFHFYAGRIVPKVGALFSREEAPYAYLGSSIIKFFNTNEMENTLALAGFRKEEIIPFVFGMVSLAMFKKIS